MSNLAEIVVLENDQERDRKECIKLDVKVTGANRELARWLLDHPRYEAPTVANWLGCGATRIKDLRRWAKNGFEGKPFRPGSRRARAEAELKSLDNFGPSGGPFEEPCEDCNSPEEFWQRSAANMAGDAISLEAYWTREFGDWRKFEMTSQLVTLAKQAAKSWSELASCFERMKDKSK